MGKKIVAILALVQYTHYQYIILKLLLVLFVSSIVLQIEVMLRNMLKVLGLFQCLTGVSGL